MATNSLPRDQPAHEEPPRGVELGELSPTTGVSADGPSTSPNTQIDASIPSQAPPAPTSSTPAALSDTATTHSSTNAADEERDTVPPNFTRQITAAYIGDATDLPTPMLEAPPSAVAAGPVIQFTLLLASTGTRHPFQINEKYLSRRNVKAEAKDGVFDPGVISVYTLKELILKDWRDDWDAKPSSPSAIRLIFFGQLLADNTSLKDCKLITGGAANVLHITVKPQDFIDDEEARGGKGSMSRGRDGGRSGGCRCVIL